MPLRLARHAQALRRVHVRLREDAVGLVPGPRLPLRRRHLDLHRRDARSTCGARPASRTMRRRSASRFCERLFAALPRRPSADVERGAPARLGAVDPLSARRLPHVDSSARRRRRPDAGGADGRRRAHRALLDRLGHQARARRRDRARRQPGGAARRSRRRRCKRYEDAAQHRGAEAPERGAQLDRVVRERRALRAARARAVRLFAADAQPAHLPREPAPARRATTSADYERLDRARAPGCAARDSRAADVHAVPRCAA